MSRFENVINLWLLSLDGMDIFEEKELTEKRAFEKKLSIFGTSG